MTDDLVKKFYDKYLKGWFKKNYKFLLVILLYIFYQSNFLVSFINSFGFSISKLPKDYRVLILVLNDLIYVGILIGMFFKELKDGIKDLKKHFVDRSLLAVLCWMTGCILMTVSSLIISKILKQNVSANEALVRESIKLAPIYMLFTCSVVAPIFEEMVFRRSLSGLIRFKWLFIFSSGFLFGLLHVIGNFTGPLDFLYIIPYGSMGCAFAYLYSKTNNIALPIIIHMIHNTILVTVQILGK